MMDGEREPQETTDDDLLYGLDAALEHIARGVADIREIMHAVYVRLQHDREAEDGGQTRQGVPGEEA